MNSRNKGKHGEREFAALLREHGFDARRGQQFSGGAESPDVVSEELAWLHFEIKRVEKLNLIDACAQAEGDAGGKRWVVAHRRNHAPWLVTLQAEFFFELLREFQPVTDTNGTNSDGGETPERERTERSEGSEGPRGQASPFPLNGGGKDAVLTPREVEESEGRNRNGKERTALTHDPSPPGEGRGASGGPEDYLGCGERRGQ